LGSSRNISRRQLHVEGQLPGLGFDAVEKLAAGYEPTSKILGIRLAKPFNNAPQHHYVVEAALWNLDRGIRTGKAPPKAVPMKLREADKPSAPPSLVLDANGLGEGGVRPNL
jgi:hypothetical protein